MRGPYSACLNQDRRAGLTNSAKHCRVKIHGVNVSVQLESVVTPRRLLLDVARAIPPSRSPESFSRQTTGVADPVARIKNVSLSLLSTGTESPMSIRSKSPHLKLSMASPIDPTGVMKYPADCHTEHGVVCNHESRPTARMTVSGNTHLHVGTVVIALTRVSAVVAVS